MIQSDRRFEASGFWPWISFLSPLMLAAHYLGRSMLLGVNPADVGGIQRRNGMLGVHSCLSLPPCPKLPLRHLRPLCFLWTLTDPSPQCRQTIYMINTPASSSGRPPKAASDGTGSIHPRPIRQSTSSVSTTTSTISNSTATTSHSSRHAYAESHISNTSATAIMTATALPSLSPARERALGGAITVARTGSISQATTLGRGNNLFTGRALTPIESSGRGGGVSDFTDGGGSKSGLLSAAEVDASDVDPVLRQQQQQQRQRQIVTSISGSVSSKDGVRGAEPGSVVVVRKKERSHSRSGSFSQQQATVRGAIYGHHHKRSGSGSTTTRLRAKSPTSAARRDPDDAWVSPESTGAKQFPQQQPQHSHRISRIHSDQPPQPLHAPLQVEIPDRRAASDAGLDSGHDHHTMSPQYLSHVQRNELAKERASDLPARSKSLHNIASQPSPLRSPPRQSLPPVPPPKTGLIQGSEPGTFICLWLVRYSLFNQILVLRSSTYAVSFAEAKDIAQAFYVAFSDACCRI